ncbi:19402_t:CDS:1, partial [Dentiscutata erythropus]
MPLSKNLINTNIRVKKQKQTPSTFVWVNEDEIQSDLNQKINNLKLDLINQEETLIAYEYNRKRAIYEYLVRLNKNSSKMAASKASAKIVYIDPAENKGTTIIGWANYWLEHNCLPESQQGKHKKIKSLSDNEDFIKKCHEWIHSQNGITCPSKFKKFVEDTFLKDLDKKTICISTVSQWLRKLGYNYRQIKK